MLSTQPSEKTAKHGDIVGEASVKRQKPQAAKKKMTDAEIHAALRKCFFIVVFFSIET